MNYKKLEGVDLHKLSKATLIKWVDTLYKKGKKISHSEKLHKHDSVFWKRQLSKKVSENEMQYLCEIADESRSLI